MLKKLKRAIKASEAVKFDAESAQAAFEAVQTSFEIADRAYLEADRKWHGEVMNPARSEATWAAAHQAALDARAALNAAKDQIDAASKALWHSQCTDEKACAKVRKILEKMLAQYK